MSEILHTSSLLMGKAPCQTSASSSYFQFEFLAICSPKMAWGWDLGLAVGIWASRLGFGPQGWDMGLQTEIWAWRLGGGGYKKEGEEGENSPYM